MEFLYVVLCLVASILITPVIKKLSLRFNITDQPNYRKVHSKVMPRLGGLAVYISFLIGLLVFRPQDPHMIYLFIGSLIIIITGILDDIYDISPKFKFLGQMIAAGVAISGGFDLEFINLPFGGQLDFGVFTIPITILWIVGITNAINLIDGLDGLAAGVSSIGLITISFMAFLQGDQFVMMIALLMLGSTLGFLVYNFHPAKIFMGDTGALFLGYMFALLSLLGFKNITFFSFIIPIIILGVPISDTFFAIIRRMIHNKPLTAPDQYHLHHRLLENGFSHRQAVLVIYGIAVMFSLAAVIFSMATVWGSLILLVVLLIGIEVFVEMVGLISKDYKPLLRAIGGKQEGVSARSSRRKRA